MKKIEKIPEKLAIVVHPIYRFLMDEYDPGLKKFSQATAEKILELTEPFFVSRIDNVVSKATGETLNADAFSCPLLMEQMISLSRTKVLKKLLRSIALCESHGASLINLVAYLAMIVGRNSERIIQRTATPITTGINMTMAVIPEAVFRAVDALDLQPKKLKALVFGANPMAYMVATQLAKNIGQVHIHHTSEQRALTFYNSLPEMMKMKIKLETNDAGKLLPQCDIVINVTGTLPKGFDEKYLKKGAVVYDASYPRTIRCARKDVLLVDGVAMHMPGNKPDFHFNFGLPRGMCYPCMAEAMTLFFEKRFESYSFDRNITEERANAIYMLALKHGFNIGALTCGELVIAQETIETVKDRMHSRERTFVVF